MNQNTSQPSLLVMPFALLTSPSGSRLIRLIPLPQVNLTGEDKERQAIYNLMAYRFPAEAAEKVVREIWMEIVEGRSKLWEGIGEDKKECIRGKWPSTEDKRLPSLHYRV